jgi:hypothetical protein
VARDAYSPRFCPGLQPEAGQRNAAQGEAEFFQRLPARDGLGQSLGQFIEYVVHDLPFDLLLVVCSVQLRI